MNWTQNRRNRHVVGNHTRDGGRYPVKFISICPSNLKGRQNDI